MKTNTIINRFFVFGIYLCIGMNGLTHDADGRTLTIGAGQTYPTIRLAAEASKPGDTLLLRAGNHAPDQFIGNLQGTRDAPIVIRGEGDHAAIFHGGGQSLLMEDPAYLRFENIVFEAETDNGVHLHDGDSYATPAHHIVFDSCWFRDIAGTGNNDQLKASGLDSFTVKNCRFINGAHGGGSGIDMVGCHNGVIIGNTFENQGNPLQTKGGSRFIRIEGNVFKNVTMRTINVGGNTDMQYFRPIDAAFEAANIQIFSNVFINCTAPVCYVGCINVDAVNNTIYAPVKYVVRILQESVDPSRFVPCGSNSFRNNIIVVGDAVTTECNIGPDTDPQSFKFSNNLWYAIPGSSWTKPRDLPVVDSAGIIGRDPLFVDAANGDFDIEQGSPARGAGHSCADPGLDFNRRSFALQRAIGAFEASALRTKYEVVSGNASGLAINRSGRDLQIQFDSNDGEWMVEIVAIDGKVIARSISKRSAARIPVQLKEPGTFIVKIRSVSRNAMVKLVVF